MEVLLKLGCWLKKIYNSHKHRLSQGLGMPDYPEYTFGIYSLRLRPNDSLRMGIARLGLPDLLNFFNASNIELMLRVGVPNKKENKYIEDVLNYEWVLSTEDDKQVERMNDPRFNFYNCHTSLMVTESCMVLIPFKWSLCG